MLQSAALQHLSSLSTANGFGDAWQTTELVPHIKIYSIKGFVRSQHIWLGGKRYRDPADNEWNGVIKHANLFVSAPTLSLLDCYQMLPVTPNGYQWHIMASPIHHRFSTDYWLYLTMKHYEAMAHGTQPSQNLPMSLRSTQHGWVHVAAAPPWILPSAEEKATNQAKWCKMTQNEAYIGKIWQDMARYGKIWQDMARYGKMLEARMTSSIRDNTPGPTMCDSISMVRRRLNTTAESSTFIMEPLALKRTWLFGMPMKASGELQ